MNFVCLELQEWMEMGMESPLGSEISYKILLNKRSKKVVATKPQKNHYGYLKEHFTETFVNHFFLV